MKKTFIAAALLVAFGVANACNNGNCTSSSTTQGSTVNAGVTAGTSATAISAGNGSALSINAAGQTASATGINVVGANKNIATGGAAVGGLVTTGGYSASLSATTGNAVASGLAFGEACAVVVENASYTVTGPKSLSGNASGSAFSTNGNVAATGSGPGNGLAVAGNVSGNTAGFEATSYAVRTGANYNSVDTTSSAASKSFQLGGSFSVGNAAAGQAAAPYGSATAAANATAGNLCSNVADCQQKYGR